MKKLEKNDLKNIQGAGVGRKRCWDNGNGTSSCIYIGNNGQQCFGTYTYGGATIFLDCTGGL